MPASLKFESAAGIVATQADLSDAKIVIYEDDGGNKYTLDASGVNGLTNIDDIKLSTLKDVVFKYHPSTGSEAPVTGLGSIIGALFATQSTSSGKSVLAEKVATKPVVDAILAAEDANAGNVKIVETELEKTFAKTSALADKANTADVYTQATANTTFVKTDGTNASTPAVATAIVGSAEFKAAVLNDGNGAPITTVADLVTKLAAGSADAGVYSKTGADAAFAKTSTSSAQDLSDYLKTADLKIKVVEKEVVEALVPALSTVGTGGTKQVYTKAEADTALALKAATTDLAGLVKVDGSNVTSHADGGKALAAAILGAKDGQKLVLVTELGKALDTANTDYDGSKTAKAFLGEKGLKPTAAEVAADPTLLRAVKDDVKITVNAEDPGFAGAVRVVVSTPVFDIPDDDTPLNWDF